MLENEKKIQKVCQLRTSKYDCHQNTKNHHFLTIKERKMKKENEGERKIFKIQKINIHNFNAKQREREKGRQ